MNLEDPLDRVPYSPWPTRPKLTWPDGHRVALWIAPNVEHYEFVPPPNRYYDSYPRVAAPDVQQFSYREYGNRVGFWRMLELLDEFAVRATVSLNVGVLDLFPEIADAMLGRDWDFLSHGLYNTRPLFGYSEEAEREFFEDTCSTFEAYAGRPLRGMLGPAVSVTPRTFDLMAEYGFTYTADFFHDDQPTPVLTDRGRLVSVPYTVDLNDGNLGAAGALHVLPERAKAQFDQLWEDGASSGTVMCLALHPYIVGMPHQLRHLRAVLEYATARGDVWFATAGEIADHYLAHCYDEQLNASTVYGAAAP
jgi:peptidoglycan/xylan/chitin deacetylase (PgdA/CDA1 family)